jgi:HlyD family secretion protein
MPEPKKRKTRKFAIITVVLLIAAGAGMGAYFKRREKPVLIQTEQVTRRNLTELVTASGRIQPVVQVKISPEVSGEIIELPVKEGQHVKKGELLVHIKPDFYEASRRSAEAAFRSSEAGRSLAEAHLAKAESEYKRNKELLANQLISESVYIEVKTSLDVGRASFRSAKHQVDVAKAALDRAVEELAKTTIVAPIDGTVSRLTSQVGERVVGTAMMTGTEIMTVADLNDMEARVDIGEIDVVLIAVGQKARLDVDAFRDRKFAGIVTEIANSSRASERQGNQMPTGQAQEATRFEIRIRIQEREAFRPGMSVSAEIETRSRTNVLTVPIQSVTTRLPKGTNGVSNTNIVHAPTTTNHSATAANKGREETKPIEVIFLREGETVRAQPVKRGISDDNYTEIIEGAPEGAEVVSGGYKAISRDLEDGKKVALGTETTGQGSK